MSKPKTESGLSTSYSFANQWYRIKATGYIFLLIATAPLCFMITVCVWLFVRNSKNDSRLDTSLRRKVLISGVAHTKGLHVAKTLAKAGHHVVLADAEDFWCSAARWSCLISKFYTVPNLNSADNNEAYISGMVKIAEKENIDWYIPISHTKTSISDTIVKQRLAKLNPEIKCLVFNDAQLTITLDDKLLFLEECKKLNLDVPYFQKVESSAEVYEMVKTGLFLNSHYFLKPLLPYSVHRLNFTPIPRDPKEFDTYIAPYEAMFEKKNPYLIHQFIKGKEFAANAIVVNGNLQAFHISPCSPVQINYGVSKHPKIKMWVENFCKAKKITGCICFDFMEDEESGKIYCIECNPRLHSSIVSYHMHANLERAIRGAMEVEFQLYDKAEPQVPSLPVYWLYNEIGKFALLQQSISEFVGNVLGGKEAVFDLSDPWPFFMLNHCQIPFMLLQAVTTGNRWTYVNYCLGQLR
ncbi:uncharacterized protein [Montipora capricornis]|uniref:uncharacterized protein n=1 Tax=Montipora capricornis TaxID=246305 RepID=UPI0035F1C9F3